MGQTRVAVGHTDQDAQRALLASLAADSGLAVVPISPFDGDPVDVDVLVLGSHGDAQQGARLCAGVTSAHPDLRVMLIVDTDRPIEVLTGFAAGARGLVLWADDADTLCNGVRHLAMGHDYVDPALAHALVQLAVAEHPDPAGLTADENETLELLGIGVRRHD